MIKDERDEENKVGIQMEAEFSRILTVHSLSIKMGDYLMAIFKSSVLYLQF